MTEKDRHNPSNEKVQLERNFFVEKYTRKKKIVPWKNHELLLSRNNDLQKKYIKNWTPSEIEQNGVRILLKSIRTTKLKTGKKNLVNRY